MNNIPKTLHWAIITIETIHIPGDERSRTHPGHGYPAENMEIIKYKVFTDYDDWVFQVKRLTEQKKEFRAIEARPANINVKVDIKVE